MAKLTRISAEAKRHSRELRLGMSEAERRLWQHLRGRQMGGYKFRRQYSIGRYLLDFVCLEVGLVIEVDGGQHVERFDYDRMRTSWLEQRGLRVLRFWNHEVLSNIEDVKAVIGRELLLDSQPPSQPSPYQGEGGRSEGTAIHQTSKK